MEYFEKYQNMIDDEVAGALEYACLYCAMKDEQKTEAKEVKEIALEEINHYHILSNIAKSMITEDSILMMFEYLQKRNNKKIAEAKMMLEM